MSRFYDDWFDLIWPTRVTNRYRRLSLRELGREWGEATWTAKDLT